MNNNIKYENVKVKRKISKKEKFRVYKNRTIAVGVLIAIGLGTSIGVARYKNNKETSFENEVGYSNFTPLNKLTNKVKEENFVILDVGDYDTNGTWFLDEKISYCNENDISLGIVVNTNSSNEADIYNDVDYVKSLIKKYNIDFPVYLNIDKIITNDNLNNELKTKIIKDFLEKCSANNIYVGLNGTDTNLNRLEKYCDLDIENYDAYLVMDSNNVKYKGPYNLVKTLDGKIISKFNVKDSLGNTVSTDMSKLIKENDLNNPDNFSSDGSYTISSDEDIVDVALKYGLSVNELLKFNDMRKDDVMKGVKLRIPSIIEKEIPNELEKENIYYQKLATPIRGCDLSYAQGNNHDWNLLKKNFEYIIVRCSHGLNLDSCFEYNIKNCNLNNISVGVYCYNEFNKKNCQDIEEFSQCQNSQAEYVLSLLKNKKVDYPVYLDIEEVCINSYDEFFTKEYVNKMLEIWKSKIEGAGYTAGIYCNLSMYKYLKANSDYDLSDFELWIAGGNQYTGETKDIMLDDVKSSFDFLGDIDANMVQSTDSAIKAGASNGAGHLDINYSMIDYSKKVKVSPVNNTNNGSNWKIKEKTTVAKEDALLIGAISTSVLALGGTYIGRKTKKERENEINSFKNGLNRK